MPSPFPGMDPYLEIFWGDVHTSLVTYARDQLQTRLPGDLRARVEERVVVESPEAKEHPLYPDIRVVERGHGRATAMETESGVAVAEPLVLDLEDEPETQRFIEIIDIGSNRRVVTVIEILSLSNKQPGEGQDLYLKKQRELIDGHVSLVEIDLLRAGKRVLSVPPRRIPRSHRTTYQVCVRRGWVRKKAEIYRAALRKRLPTINVPLRETDTDCPLDLQALVEQCYRNGGYDDDIDCRANLDPSLEPEDAAWADDLLRRQAKR